MKKLGKILRYSNVYLNLRLNPFTWTWIPEVEGKYRSDPYDVAMWGIATFELTFLGLNLKVFVDDGSW